ncbi:MAG: DUF1501 domain-containing protein [Akkermansiaceae bacterium]|nr:DUF1501 domain-containing protein [Akkermansiaceae bacterium]
MKSKIEHRRSNIASEASHTALLHQTRRHFLRTSTSGLGAMWLATTAGRSFGAAVSGAGATDRTDHAPKAKRVIFLHMAGAPSQLELFDYKPELVKYDGKRCPEELIKGERFAFITGVPNMLGPQHPFHQAGNSGAWITDLLPTFERSIDEVCFIKSMHTDQFNHAPGQLVLTTGTANLGHPSAGAWATYGLGTENHNLPGFIALVSGGNKPDAGKAAWGSGFLPSLYQGVQCRGKGDPILYLSNPEGVTQPLRRRALDALNEINRRVHRDVGDPETLTRVAQYELAYRMQMRASDAFDITREKPATLEAYGAAPGEESFANNCLLARRLAERGVRFIQLHDWGWDHHGTSVDKDCRVGIRNKCNEMDRPVGALLEDLRQRGMLEDTLVVWAGEFGRTPMKENRAGNQNKGAGRDHHKDAFTIWMAGGGVKPGFSFGETDPIGYKVVRDPVSLHDLHATILHLLGFDPKRLTYEFQGLNQRLTNVTKPSRVVKEVIA